jgi:hypothetical protein
MFSWQGRLFSTLVFMFYSTAFMPFIYLTHYVDRMGPAVRRVMLNEKILDPSAVLEINPAILVVGGLIQLPVIIYVIAKSAQVVKFVHRIGYFRAVMVICLAGMVEQIYEYLIWIPLLGEVIKDFGITSPS